MPKSIVLGFEVGRVMATPVRDWLEERSRRATEPPKAAPEKAAVEGSVVKGPRGTEWGTRSDCIEPLDQVAEGACGVHGYQFNTTRFQTCTGRSA